MFFTIFLVLSLHFLCCDGFQIKTVKLFNPHVLSSFGFHENILRDDAIFPLINTEGYVMKNVNEELASLQGQLYRVREDQLDTFLCDVRNAMFLDDLVRFRNYVMCTDGLHIASFEENTFDICYNRGDGVRVSRSDTIGVYRLWLLLPEYDVVIVSTERFSFETND